MRQQALAALAATQDDAERLDTADIVSLSALLLLAGFETTTNLIANSIHTVFANPDVFEAPDELRLDRAPNPHLAFSSGIHHCLGAALARLEAEIAVPAIIRHLPGLQLAERPRRRETFVLRGFDRLTVRWDGTR